MYLKRLLFICIISVSGIFSLRAQKTGVMVMAHGGSAQWNDLVTEAVQPLRKNYPVSIAWGMGDPNTLQKSVDDLEGKGVTRIIAIPLFISSHSMVIRQTEYLLGMRDSLADAPMPPMDHSGVHTAMSSHTGGHSSGMQDHSGMSVHSGNASSDMHSMMSFELKPLKIKSQIVLTPALDDNDVVAGILLDRITALSTSPSGETVILVAHGPNGEDDNKKWITNLESLSMKIQKLQEKKGKDFKQIFALTVRDDASKDIFDQAREQLRALVRQAGHFGTVIVVPVFLSSGGREDAVAQRLEGLNYKWNGKALLPDSRLSDFLVSSVNQAVQKKYASKK